MPAPATTPTPRSEATGVSRRPPAGADVLFYDGVCALCNGFVRFLLARDRDRRLRYAALQSEFARQALTPLGEDPADLSTVLLLQGYGGPEQRLFRRSRATLAALRRLGGGWGLLARTLSIVPTVLLDAGYRLVASARYSLFGRYDSCPLPSPELRDLFIDSPSAPPASSSARLGAAGASAHGNRLVSAADRAGAIAPGGDPDS